MALNLSREVRSRGKKIIEELMSELKDYNSDIFIEVGFDGTKRYYSNATRMKHRADGPAIEFADGSVSYFLSGIAMESAEEWFSFLNAEQQEKVLFNSDVMASKNPVKSFKPFEIKAIFNKVWPQDIVITKINKL